jgi:hypothetical protein
LEITSALRATDVGITFATLPGDANWSRNAFAVGGGTASLAAHV